MNLASGRSRLARRRVGTLERLAAFSQTWVFALISAIVAVGAVASCDSAPPIVHTARD